jgi:serine/threonine protein kinase
MDLTSAHLGLGRDEFIANLTEAKLLPEEELARIVADESSDVMKLADDLLNSGLITDYQQTALTTGRLSDLKLGNYDLLAKLGAGGMGTVFKARHRRLKRVAAIKVLAAHLCTDAAFVQRFQREVETVARLGHPNVVMAYDADEAEMGHFLVMEFVDGRDLASEVEKAGKLSVPRAADYIIQAARGLAYAHTQGIVHRDVKPHNLLLDRSGLVKVTDLGLARLNSAATAGAGGLTQAGGILGTVDYMAPEQAVDSAAIDARADIYGLGCTLYFLLAGTPPYTGPTLVSVLLKHRDAAVPLLRRVRPDVPAGLEAVCARMMAKAVGDRYQTMSEVIAALEPFAPASSGVPAPVAGNAPRPDLTAASSGSTPPGTVSVLLVEPSRVQSAIIRQYLEAQGMTVCRAVTTGADAMAAIQIDRPTSVVASLHLADLSGVELAEQSRAATKTDSPAFVLISSETDADEQAVPRHLNRVTMLAKPFTPDQLVQALNYVTGLSVAVRSSVT